MKQADLERFRRVFVPRESKRNSVKREEQKVTSIAQNKQLRCGWTGIWYLVHRGKQQRKFQVSSFTRNKLYSPKNLHYWKRLNVWTHHFAYIVNLNLVDSIVGYCDVSFGRSRPYFNAWFVTQCLCDNLAKTNLKPAVNKTGPP